MGESVGRRVDDRRTLAGYWIVLPRRTPSAQ
jgi:hypothetical protein